MSSEIFAKCYVDEHVGSIFVNALRKKGFDVKTPAELDSIGFSDESHLQIAIRLERVLITLDKRTFLKHSKAREQKHWGHYYNN